MTAPERRSSLTPVQLAWLQELGLDRRMLQVTYETTQPASEPYSKSQQASSKQATARLGRARPQETAASLERQTASVAAHQVILPPDLQSLKAEATGCTRCGLHAGRHQVVFGGGSTDEPDWMVIGEAPGEHDEQVGSPFQGAAGRLLQVVFDASGLTGHSSFYYTNAVKCRPRAGRVPRKEEIETCVPFLHAQIDQIRPKAILVLGWLAASAVLHEKGSIEQLRERIHTYTASHGAIPVVVTYHPAALLLRARHKAQVWRDMLLARQLKEGAIQKPG